jgi:site-specific DNA-methyltransferase (adenine-specific)
MILDLNKIYLGDCLEIMKNIPDKSIDVILCDLPYGSTKCSWDVIIQFEPLWEQYNRVIKDNGAIVLFGKEPFSSHLRLSNLKMWKYDWIWRKDTKNNFPQAPYQPLNNIEIISVFSKGYARGFPKTSDKINEIMNYNPQFIKAESYKIPKESKTTDLFKQNHKNGVYKHKERDTSLRYPYNLLDFNVDKNKIHPTQKPVALLEYLIKTYTNENDIVLDNCFGSGSTGIASLNTNRKFIGIELNEDYFNLAKQRLESWCKNE